MQVKLFPNFTSTPFDYIDDNVSCLPPTLKYVFRLVENVSRVVGQKSLTPQGNNLNFPLKMLIYDCGFLTCSFGNHVKQLYKS